MNRMVFGALVASLLLFTPASAMAGALVAKVSISKQQMMVMRGGRILHIWPVSTARKGYVTPRGKWRPVRMHRMWHSRKYDNSPMPYSIFYYKGYAIHGTNAVRHLGRPASHGCVRLDTANAARLYALVKSAGPANTRIVVTD